MRFFIPLLFLATPVLADSSQAPVRTHLDCVFNEQDKTLICPNVLGGDNIVHKIVDEAKAQEEARHKRCDKKYRSYNRKTGMYKAYSGKMKPCL